MVVEFREGALALHFTDDVECDSHRPGLQLTVTAKCAQLLQESKCRFLRRVRRHVGIAKLAQREAVPHILQRIEKPGLRLAVATSGCLDGLTVHACSFGLLEVGASWAAKV